MFHYMPTCQTE